MTRRPEMLNKKRRNPWLVALSAIGTVLAVLIILFVAFDLWLTSTCFVVEVDGSSMENTLRSGELLYAKKTDRAQRGDIVILDVSDYRDAYVSGDLLVKRLIATEGDEVYCEAGVVYVCYAGETQFTPLNEPYVKGRTNDFDRVVVGEGEVFFMGDNRPVSHDSRAEGCLPAEEIVGVVPDWAVTIKGFSTAWEGFRSSLRG